MKTKKQSSFHLICITLIGIFILVSVLSLLVGGGRLSTDQVFSGLLLKEEAFRVIIYSIRLPRLLAGVLAGVGLSVSGVLIQSITSNDLASPNIIGVNSGAGFACIISMALFPASFIFAPVAAFLGAFLTGTVIILVSQKTGGDKSTLILTGIAITTLLNAGISFISLLDTDLLSAYSHFSVGGLSSVGPNELVIPAVLIMAALTISLVLSRRISVLTLGDESAQSLGVNARALRAVCMALACVSAASVVSFAGLLGFVGLIVPHVAKKIVGPSVKKLVVASAIIGAITVVFADLVGRLLLSPSEIPVGIIMALVGAPFFLALVIRRKKYA